MNKTLFIVFFYILFCSHNSIYAAPKMKKIQNNDLNIEISETLVTMKDFKEYISSNNIQSIFDFERKKISECDIYYGIKFNDDWPVWYITWREAAKYCNWLSENAGYKSCYVFKNATNNSAVEIAIDRTANGYRLPYIRELLVISGIKNGLSKEKYEQENICNLEKDINKMIPLPVYDGKRNEFGVYDVLGNFAQYCNDYYLDGYNYFDYSLSPYGPEEFSPDLDQVWYNEPLTAVRCYFGGYWFDTYKDIQEKLIFDVNEITTEFVGIRLVRDLQY